MAKNNSISDDTIIWRYMKLESFINLISKKELSFSRFDLLKKLDPYECSQSKKELEQQDLELKVTNAIGKRVDNPLLQDPKFLQKIYTNSLEEMNKQYFINCWHINDIESVAMWNSFTNSETGIAIKTTLGNLKKSIINKNKYNLNYERITYVDLNTYTGSISPLLRKTKYFEYEQELRVYFSYIESKEFQSHQIDSVYGKTPYVLNKINNPERIGLSIDLPQLINKIVVSPKSEDWFINVIIEFLKTCKINITPMQSIIKTNNIKLDNEERYKLINPKIEVEKIIENSSFGEAAKHATYRVNYDETTGKIKGCYPSNIDYKNIPKPYINATFDEWQKWLNNQSSAKVDLITKKIVFDK